MGPFLRGYLRTYLKERRACRLDSECPSGSARQRGEEFVGQSELPSARAPSIQALLEVDLDPGDSQGVGVRLKCAVGQPVGAPPSSHGSFNPTVSCARSGSAPSPC